MDYLSAFKCTPTYQENVRILTMCACHSQILPAHSVFCFLLWDISKFLCAP